MLVRNKILLSLRKLIEILKKDHNYPLKFEDVCEHRRHLDTEGYNTLVAILKIVLPLEDQSSDQNEMSIHLDQKITKFLNELKK